MKQARLLVTAMVVLTMALSAVSAFACDKDKAKRTSASSSTKSVTAVTADFSTAKAASSTSCTAAQMAACKAKAGTKGVSAVTISAGDGYSCGDKSAKGVSAVTISAGDGAHCGSKSSTKTSAMAAGSGHCSGQGMARAAGKSVHADHGDCDACADMSLCGDEISAAGARTQVVPLKNGVMFVYTAETPGKANAVQASMARRNERMTQFLSAGEKARLCAECKSMRGAMAKGKLNREVVNIEGGCLTLMTSDDPSVVAKIHAMVDVKGSTRTDIKS